MSCGHRVVGITNGHSIHAGPLKGLEFLSIYLPRGAKLRKKTKLNGCVCNDLAIANQTSCRNVTHVEAHKDNNGNFKKLGG
jgi:hypothetical protein